MQSPRFEDQTQGELPERLSNIDRLLAELTEDLNAVIRTLGATSIDSTATGQAAQFCGHHHHHGGAAGWIGSPAGLA